MPSPERFKHRPLLSDIDKTDSVEIAPVDLPEEPPREDLPIAVMTANAEQPILNLHDVHEAAVTEARLRQLDERVLEQLTHQTHRDNHAATKQQVIDSLRTEVVPDPSEELSPQDEDYYQSLDQSLSEIFSAEPDGNGNSQLEQEFETVLSIESIEDEVGREAARRGYIAGLAQRLGARPEDAEAIYWRLADQPEVYRALKQQRQVLLLIEHEPERYEEFIQLTRTGDPADIDAFFVSIENEEVREQLQTLRSDEREVTKLIERRRVERLERSRASFSDTISSYDGLTEPQQILLGLVAERSAPEFLTLVREASLVGNSDGLSGTFLNRPLRIEHDGRAFLGSATIRQFDATGIRRAAAVDTARLRHCDVFNELAETTAGRILEPLFQLDPVESLPVQSDLSRIAHVLDTLGLKTGVADGWLILREFQLLDDHNQPNIPGIRRLIRQFQELGHQGGASFDGLDAAMLRRLLVFWDAEGADPRRSTILTANEMVALPESA